MELILQKIAGMIGGIAMPQDMLVKLYQVEEKPELCEKLQQRGISVKRAMPADAARVVQFVKNNFGDGWAHDCSYTFTAHPVSCFIAVRDKKVIGFACYDAAAKDFFGPVGVYEKYRGMGIGETLLRTCLLSMKNDGYAYAVVGWTDEAAGFYEKTVGATGIPDSFPGIYRNLISAD
jgi:predicted N-acetyltransferase YhbS